MQEGWWHVHPGACCGSAAEGVELALVPSVGNAGAVSLPPFPRQLRHSDNFPGAREGIYFFHFSSTRVQLLPWNPQPSYLGGGIDFSFCYCFSWCN